MGHACSDVSETTFNSLSSFHLAIHIIAHLFNFEHYSKSRQATDGSLASVLSILSHQEKGEESWLNPISSPNMVSWLNGEVSAIWSWVWKGMVCLAPVNQAEISPFVDSGVCDIYQHCWSHWSDHHNSSGSHGDFSCGVYPEELFWGLLVHAPCFHHLLHWFRDSWHWVRSLNPHSHAPAPDLA